MKPLWKTTVVIWSPAHHRPQKMELSELAREAETGDACCTSLESHLVAEPEQDPDWNGTDFFAEEEA